MRQHEVVDERREQGDQRSYEAHLPKHGAIESSDSQDREQEDLALPRVQP